MWIRFVLVYLFKNEILKQSFPIKSVLMFHILLKKLNKDEYILRVLKNVPD